MGSEPCPARLLSGTLKPSPSDLGCSGAPPPPLQHVPLPASPESADVRGARGVTVPLGLGCSTQLGKRLKYRRNCSLLQPVIPTARESGLDEVEQIPAAQADPQGMEPAGPPALQQAAGLALWEVGGTLPTMSLGNAKLRPPPISSVQNSSELKSVERLHQNRVAQPKELIPFVHL